MLQSRPISGRPLSGRLIDGRASGMRSTGAGFASGSLRPLAPVLTWVSDETVNPPQIDIDLDDTKVWLAGEIDASNFDRIELEIDTDIAFGGPSTFTHDLDAADLAALTFSFPITTQPGGVALYARSRHKHYVGGVAHISTWSNVETKTLVVNNKRNIILVMRAG